MSLIINTKLSLPLSNLVLNLLHFSSRELLQENAIMYIVMACLKQNVIN